MPRRSKRGGKRQGTAGVVYGQRSDLNVERAPTQPTVNIPGQTYGAAVPQGQIQQGAPLPAQRTPEQLAQGFDFAAARQGLTPLDAESQQPDEPLTAGMAMGAGPGPEALSPMMQGGTESVLNQLRAVYLRYPNEHIRELIEEAENDEGLIGGTSSQPAPIGNPAPGLAPQPISIPQPIPSGATPPAPEAPSLLPGVTPSESGVTPSEIPA